MKDYPSIPAKWRTDVRVYAFDKLDGSNVKAEWNQRQGWYKYGSRTQLLADNSGHLNEAKGLIVSKYGDDLARVFRRERYQSAVAFFEFWGPQSFAGSHAVESHTVTLLDVDPYRKGILPPQEFLDLYGGLDVPAMLYEGVVDDDFVQSVRESTLEGMTLEGVVCKKKVDHRESPTMFKLKSRAWLDRLRVYCGSDEGLFERLK